jgi:EAL domain-containing protein (putative c-di-GMP-specific phosphodiesterase class I)/GGDEF domain-containing protein
MAAVATIAFTAASWGAGFVPALIAAPATGLALAAILMGMHRHSLAEQRAAVLSDSDGAVGKPMLETLEQISARMELLKRDASVHPTTQLPTRTALQDAIDRDIAAGCAARVVGLLRFADFERIAAFDSGAADEALAQLARRLVTATQRDHFLAQVDADSFGVWLRGDDLAAALAELRAIAYVASQDMQSGDRILTPTINVSTAKFPDDGSEGAQLIRRAAAARDNMPISKLGVASLAAPPSAEQARQQFLLEQGLVRAIAEEQLAMVFQPVVDLSAGRMIGAEALLRWTHPSLGAISPAKFIPIVETLGLSESYGLWVLNAACREARRWQDEGLAGLKLAVNLSARQLLDPRLRPKIERTLKRHGLDPSALELELTETAAMVDAERTVQLFGQMRTMGISLAIDDFGTGYSSLSYLKNLPFDKLKIDREFVTDIQDRSDNRAICKALIELGHGLGLLVLAEGAESEAEVETLWTLGCTVFQGFYFSRPLSGDAFLALARDATWLSSLDQFRLRNQAQHQLRLSA